MFKLIVAGSRNFNDFLLLRKKLDALLINKKDIEIVSGKCPPRFKYINDKKVKIRGADRLGEIYSRINKYKLKRFAPDWSKGLKAGTIRNAEMAEYGNGLVLFWQKTSKGSASMLKEAKKRNLVIKEVIY